MTVSKCLSVESKVLYATLICYTTILSKKSRSTLQIPLIFIPNRYKNSSHSDGKTPKLGH